MPEPHKAAMRTPVLPLRELRAGRHYGGYTRRTLRAGPMAKQSFFLVNDGLVVVRITGGQGNGPLTSLISPAAMAPMLPTTNLMHHRMLRLPGRGGVRTEGRPSLAAGQPTPAWERLL